MNPSGERPIPSALGAEEDLHALPSGDAPTSAFSVPLSALTRAGAGYAALIHSNGVSIADSSVHEMPTHRRDELAILATAMISASQALARSLGAGACGLLQQHFESGGLLLQPITPDHWLLAAAPDRASLDNAAAMIPALCPPLRAALEEAPDQANARFMDAIEFTDLSDLTFD